MALKRSSRLIAISVVLMSCLPAETLANGLVRIMPLGDSITYGIGSTNNNGYRKPLCLELLNAGYKIDLVGSLINGDFIDPDHEGHLGWHAAGGTNGEVLTDVYDRLVANPADIILLHIGTNDILFEGQDPNEISDILDEIDRYSEDVTVILALIINRQTYNLATTEFNNGVNDMALGRIAAGDKIIIVDMENALNYSTDMSDNLHPDDNGYTKMAEVWYEALVGSLKDGIRESNQRLEFLSSSKLENFVDYYIANGWRIDVNDSFDAKVDFHYSDISSRPGWIGINISDGTNYFAISAGSDSNTSYFYYETVADGNIVFEKELRASNDGTLYCRYDADSNAVYLSHTGFDANDAYIWQNTSNPLQIQWSSSVDIAIGGGSGHVYLWSGEAYLENFEVTDAKLLDWLPKTDLDHDGYIDLPDLAELCDHWLDTGSGIPSDFQPDGTVNMEDLSIFGLAW